MIVALFLIFIVGVLIKSLFERPKNRTSQAKEKVAVKYEKEEHGDINSKGYSEYKKGFELISQGLHQQALPYLDKAIEYGYKDSKLYGCRGSCLQLRNYHYDAIEDFDQAIALDAKDCNNYYCRSVSRGAIKAHEGQCTDLIIAIKLSKENTSQNRNYNETTRKMGKWDSVTDMFMFELLMAQGRLESQREIDSNPELKSAYEDIQKSRVLRRPDLKSGSKSNTPVDRDQVIESKFFRANLNRTGHFKSKGLRSLSGVKWKYKTNGIITTSSIIFDGVIYFGSKDNSLYALNCQTGKLIWRYETNSPVITCPVIEEGIIYFASSNSYLYAFNLNTRKLMWNIKLNVSSESITALKSTLYFGSHDMYFKAVDRMSGNLIWKFKTKGVILACASFEDEIIYFGSSEGHFYALNCKDGQLVWKFNSKHSIFSSAVVKDGMVIFSSSGKRVFALSSATGKLIWCFQNAGTIQTSPALFNNDVYFNCGDRILAINCNTGKESRQYSLKRTAVSTPSIADHIVYFGYESGGIDALDINTGKILWRKDSGPAIRYAPIIVDGIVYYGCADSYFYALH